MHDSALTPCEGCGALFPPYDGPTHKYLGASAGCWALHCWSTVPGGSDVTELVAQSRVPDNRVRIPPHNDTLPNDWLWGDAYGVQHHGGTSPQAIQSVAVHLLDLHAVITGRTTRPLWALGRALRIRGVFHKLEPPPLGSALTWRHLFPGGGVSTPVTRGQYAVSVYETWIALHRAIVDEWYERYVLPDDIRAHK